MSVHIRLEVKDDLDAYQQDLQASDDGDAIDTSVPDNQPPPTIVLELVKQATLGRGEDDTKTFSTSDPQSEAAFHASMAEVTSTHIDLAAYHAHNRGVSRKHARLTLRNLRISVRDLGSTNGTFINNERLEPNVDYPIKEGDELRLGFMTLMMTVLKVDVGE